MKLYVLSCGEMNVEKAFIWHFGPKENSGKEYSPESYRLGNTQYYIEHPDAKILVDAGWTLEDFGKGKKKVQSDKPKKGGFPSRKNEKGITQAQNPDENPVAQLSKIGVAVEDIDFVVMSHLMCEHAGWLPVFAGKKARVVVQQNEYDYAHRIAMPNIPGEPLPVEQFHSWMYMRHHFDIPGLKFKFIEGDYELVNGVDILSVPGHTPGYQAVHVRLQETGSVVLSLCEHLGHYYDIPINGSAPGIPHAFTWFAAGELQSLKRIRDLVEKEQGQIFCGHDWSQRLTLKHVPEYYE